MEDKKAVPCIDCLVYPCCRARLLTEVDRLEEVYRHRDSTARLRLIWAYENIIRHKCTSFCIHVVRHMDEFTGYEKAVYTLLIKRFKLEEYHERYY